MPTFVSEDSGNQVSSAASPSGNAPELDEGAKKNKVSTPDKQDTNARSIGEGAEHAEEYPVPIKANAKVESAICLILSCMMSFVLVCVVALLIALMQFQGRLTLAQPKITAGRLVYLANLEKSLENVTNSMASNRKILARAGLNLTKGQTELNFRINRLCAAFATLPPDRQYVPRCEWFLSRIPFDFIPQKFEAMQKELSYDDNSAEGVGYSPVAMSLDGDSLKKIEDKFARYMDNPTIGGQKFSEFEYLYASDISAIAFLNQVSALRLQPLYAIAQGNYLEDCRYSLTLVDGVRSYRDVEELHCLGGPSVEDVVAQNQSGNAGDRAVSQPPVSIPPQGAAARPAGDTQAAPRQPIDEPPQKTGVRPMSRPAAEGASSDQPASVAAPPVRQFAADSKPGELQSQQSTVPAPPALAGRPTDGSADLPSGAPLFVSQDDTILAERQRVFDLVSSYRFYDSIAPGVVKSVIISPGEFLALLLVCFGGVLGAFLKIIFSTSISSRDPDFRDLIVRPILGLICALVLYILLRAGFIAITDHAEQAGSANLSPFVIVFVSLTAGLLSDRAVALLERSSATLLGASEPSEVDRWAVGLKDALVRKGMSVDEAAARLRVEPKVIQDWMDDLQEVSYQQQRDLSLVLGVSPRLLFTDQPPS